VGSSDLKYIINILINLVVKLNSLLLLGKLNGALSFNFLYFVCLLLGIFMRMSLMLLICKHFLRIF
jgi:hypothetical protein